MALSAFSEPVTDLIRRRASWRSFADAPVDPADRARIAAFFRGLDPPPFGSAVRVELVDAPRGISALAGTYGMVRGALHFLVGAAENGPRDMEDFGFLFEQVILFATSLSLSTCWIGATFRRGPFGDLIGLAENETIPAVSPVGYAAGRRTMKDRLSRWVVSSARRKPWEEMFFSGNFSRPLSREAAGDHAECLEMVRLGPSATNKQPWRIVADQGRFHLFLARSPGYRAVVPGPDMQRIDMGIAMSHFWLTAREQGLPGAWTQADPGLPLPQGTEYVATWL